MLTAHNEALVFEEVVLERGFLCVAVLVILELAL